MGLLDLRRTRREFVVELTQLCCNYDSEIPFSTELMQA
jgi:hypothetical protein